MSRCRRTAGYSDCSARTGSIAVAWRAGTRVASTAIPARTSAGRRPADTRLNALGDLDAQDSMNYETSVRHVGDGTVMAHLSPLAVKRAPAYLDLIAQHCHLPADEVASLLRDLDASDSPPLPPRELDNIIRQGLGEQADGPAPHYVFLNDAQLDRLPSISWDLDGILPTGGLSFLVGVKGTGKTFLAIDWACSIALGRPWQGREVRRGSVVYVAAEGVRSLHTRVGCWKFFHQVPHSQESGVHWLPGRLPLLETKEVAAFVSELAAHNIRPDLLILDTFPRCTQGAAENDADSMGRALALSITSAKHSGPASCFSPTHRARVATTQEVTRAKRERPTPFGSSKSRTAGGCCRALSLKTLMNRWSSV
jgi:hypothetical protein